MQTDPHRLTGKKVKTLFHNYGTPFPSICGFLFKRGKWNKSYKKRWFVFHDDTLSLVYMSSPLPKEKVKGGDV